MHLNEHFNELVKVLLTLQITGKLYHWRTVSHARHQATGGLNDSLDELIDKLVEVFIGRHECKPLIRSIKINELYLDDDKVIDYLKTVVKYLESINDILGTSDLMNIRDELLSEINKTLYLFKQN